jgi:hypothetical protein
MRGTFIILDKEGQPVSNIDGKRIEFTTRPDAEQFLKHGERVMPVRDKLHLPSVKA